MIIMMHNLENPNILLITIVDCGVGAEARPELNSYDQNIQIATVKLTLGPNHPFRFVCMPETETTAVYWHFGWWVLFRASAKFSDKNRYVNQNADRIKQRQPKNNDGQQRLQTETIENRIFYLHWEWSKSFAVYWLAIWIAVSMAQRKIMHLIELSVTRAETQWRKVRALFMLMVDFVMNNLLLPWYRSLLYWTTRNEFKFIDFCRTWTSSGSWHLTKKNHFNCKWLIRCRCSNDPVLSRSLRHTEFSFITFIAIYR